MSHSPFTPPSLEPFGWHYDLAPGPLSPAWPAAVAPARPEDEYMALAGELAALRGACARSLDKRRGDGPFLLGRAECARLNAVFATLKTVNAGLPHHVRVPAATRWPEPALPKGALFGARDLLPLLAAAIIVATEASRYRVVVAA